MILKFLLILQVKVSVTISLPCHHRMTASLSGILREPESDLSDVSVTGMKSPRAWDDLNYLNISTLSPAVRIRFKI